MDKQEYYQDQHGHWCQCSLCLMQTISSPQISDQEENYQYENEESISKEQDFQILTSKNLKDQLNNQLEEVQTITNLPKGWCLLLLDYFKWDKHYLREEYYNDPQEHLRKIGFRHNFKSPTDLKQGQNGLCQICYTNNVTMYTNICDHSFCLQCWTHHLESSIQKSIFPKCMDSDCRCPVLYETTKEICAFYGDDGEKLLDRLQRNIGKAFIKTKKDYIFCTGINCNNCIKANVQIDTVQCSCGKIFCFKCQMDNHYPCSCQESYKWMNGTMVEYANASWIAENTRICPSCNLNVERSEGSIFIVCQCGEPFCYQCSRPWKPSHQDRFKCQSKHSLSKSSTDRKQIMMGSVSHYIQHYSVNQRLANFCKEFDVLSNQKYLLKTLRILLPDSDFIGNACRFMAEYCQRLKWIYVFKYFRGLNRKNVFEFSVEQYQKYKQNLLTLLRGDLGGFIAKLLQAQGQGEFQNIDIINQLVEQFKILKQKIVNYYNSAKNYQEKFTKELHKQFQKYY